MVIRHSPRRPRLCFVSPMVGRHPGYVPTPGQILADLFAGAGYEVIATSPALNRYLRLTDILQTIARHRNRIDLLVIDVFGESSFVGEDAASRLGRLLGKRIVMNLHNGTFPKFIARFPGWTRRVLSRADALVAPSPFLPRAVAPMGLRVGVVPNVVDLSNYQYRRRDGVRPRLFWMRSFYPYYNPAMAVRVLARLRASVPDATLVMAGRDKGVKGEVERLAASMGLNGAVRFPGFLDVEAKRREASAADIFLNTNNEDNMPVSVIEAGAMGLPVVATEVGGIRDLLTHEENALLVPDNDVEAMTEAVRRLLNEPSLAGRISENGRRLAERSSWEQVLPQWESVFEKAMAGSGGHARRLN